MKFVRSCKFLQMIMTGRFFEKTVFSIICNKCKNEDEKIFKEEESIEILKILGLIENI